MNWTPLDGPDWVELELAAKEYGLPFRTVGDLAALLKAIEGNYR